MQYNGKVDVKVSCYLIFARTGCCRVGGYSICHKSKTVFRNVTNITRECVRDFSKFLRDFELTLPSIIDRDWGNIVNSKERQPYAITIPVSDALRDGLRMAVEEMAALLLKAGLAGAKILCLFVRLGVDFEEVPAFALSNSIHKFEHLVSTKH